MLERLDRGPGVEGERGRKQRRQLMGALDHPAPLLESASLVPVEIVDESKRISLPGRGSAGKHPA